MFRRKKKEEEIVEPVPVTEAASESAPEQAPGTDTSLSQADSEASAVETKSASVEAAAGSEGVAAKTAGKRATSGRGNRVQKIGIVTSDKMQKTVLVRVDRTVLHQKYRRYVKRRSKFMAHDDLGSTTGDRVRIVETRPLSARKRWRVVEIVQKAAK
jgi:small subunit ribosomal protein S17